MSKYNVFITLTLTLFIHGDDLGEVAVFQIFHQRYLSSIQNLTITYATSTGISSICTP